MIGAPERIDALGVVPHDEKVAVFQGQEVEDLRLDGVRVLVFVHENVQKFFPVVFPDLGVGKEEIPEIDQEIVEIHGVALFLPGFVTGHDALEHLRGQAVPAGSAKPDHPGKGLAGVAGVTDAVPDGPVPGPVLPPGHPQVRHGAVDEVPGILLVEDGKASVVTDAVGPGTENPVGQVVKGPAPQPAAVPGNPFLHPGQHVPGRLVGEGGQENPFGVHPLLDEPGDTECQGPGLAAPRPGYDEYRSVPGENNVTLFLVQQFFVIVHAGFDDGEKRGRAEMSPSPEQRLPVRKSRPGRRPGGPRRARSPALTQRAVIS